jgi:ABC-type lipoprotein release transport system permease subunit
MIIFQLGWRNIWRNKRRTFVILTAVTIGVWSMIFLSAMMRGIADRMVQNGISTLTGHIQVRRAGYRNDPSIEHRITRPETIKAIIESLPSVAEWAPRIRVNAVANNARHSAGVTMVGIDPVREAGVSFIGNAKIQGKGLTHDNANDIVVGKTLLEKFETRIGHKLVMMSQDVNGDMVSRAFRIVGAYRTELESTEKQFVFISLSAAQKMLNAGGDLSEMAILLKGHRRAKRTALSISAVLEQGMYEVHTWEELLPLVTAVLKMYDGIILFWFLAVFVAMGFGLVNTILMAVFERVREFGLLRAIGLKPRLVVAEVLVESFFLIVFGSLLGNLAGFLSVLALSRHGIDLSAFAAGMEFVGMSRVIIPIVTLKDIVWANTTVFVLGLLVSLYPAIKAARFSPIQAMAHH